MFQYHGAEHKTISCFEAGDELVPAGAAEYSRLHPRCGTSFLLSLMVLCDLRLRPDRAAAWYWLVASRTSDPAIAALSDEVTSGPASTATSAGYAP